MNPLDERVATLDEESGIISGVCIMLGRDRGNGSVICNNSTSKKSIFDLLNRAMGKPCGELNPSFKNTEGFAAFMDHKYRVIDIHNSIGSLLTASYETEGTTDMSWMGQTIVMPGKTAIVKVSVAASERAKQAIRAFPHMFTIRSLMKGAGAPMEYQLDEALAIDLIRVDPALLNPVKFYPIETSEEELAKFAKLKELLSDPNCPIVLS